MEHISLTVHHKIYPSHVLQGMNTLRLEGKFCDVNLNIGDRTFQAHKIVLSCFSQYFKRFLQGDTLDNLGFEIENIGTITLVNILEFAYTGVIEITRENVQEMLMASKIFELQPLQEKCEIFASDLVDVSNCLEVLKFSNMYDFKVLKGSIIKVIEDTDRLHSLDLNPNSIFAILSEESLILKTYGLPLSEEERESFILREVIRYVDQHKSCLPLLQEYLQNMRLPYVERRFLVEASQNRNTTDAIVQHLLKLAILVQNNKNVPEVPPFWNSSTRQGRWSLQKSSLYQINSNFGTITEEFDDSEGVSPCIAIKTITLYFRTWLPSKIVCGLDVNYRNGRMFSYGSKSYSQYNVCMEEREWVSGVEVNCDWMVNNVVIKTNKPRTFGPFGPNMAGSTHVSVADRGPYNHLHSFYGTIIMLQGRKCIRQIGFVWAKYEDNMN